MFDEVLISDRPARRRRVGAAEELSFAIRLPWYRSLYLSCFDEIDLSVDGRAHSPQDLTFTLYGTTHRFDELKDRPAVLWYVLDEAEIGVRGATAPSDAAEVELSLALHFRLPYHGGNVLRQVATCTRRLPIEQRIAA